MSYTASSLRERTIEQLSQKYVYVLLAMLPLGVGLTLILGVPTLATRGLLLMAAPVLGTFVVIRSRDRSASIYPLRFHAPAEVLQAGFVVALCSSVVTLALVPYRPWYYFGMVALLYLVVALQIIAGTDGPTIVAEL